MQLLLRHVDDATAKNLQDPANHWPHLECVLYCWSAVAESLAEEVSKGGFKLEETGKFLHLQTKYPKSLSWAENLNFPPT